MKKLTQYQCEICGTTYRDESECKNCETSHKAVKSCVKANYNGYKNDGAFPKNVIIEFKDGETAKYNLAGRYPV